MDHSERATVDAGDTAAILIEASVVSPDALFMSQRIVNRNISQLSASTLEEARNVIDEAAYGSNDKSAVANTSRCTDRQVPLPPTTPTAVPQAIKTESSVAPINPSCARFSRK